ncbi:hypothetical protein IscW_ISCW013873 [Ixodes scapularis]|uniref:Uncharacterized protein n=1 Tax=Ixodes scapularis TaxID=6945 RepID=B7QM08_IXOSC|nr:hypothetical protein IscW_ISCW013873 [Ixodes scapularis]|eukprot:XP_002416213.1 hypothetical protein IscW_ISCW013873 [Ixodes scapularis]
MVCLHAANSRVGALALGDLPLISFCQMCMHHLFIWFLLREWYALHGRSCIPWRDTLLR